MGKGNQWQAHCHNNEHLGCQCADVVGCVIELREYGGEQSHDDAAGSGHQGCKSDELCGIVFCVLQLTGTRFLADLSVLCPNALIVSGLAYGIDIHAHRAALQNHFKTIGVLAHGLDRIYPAEHRKTAVSMLEQGGLLTEFTSGTNPDRQNFVKRNRIVAGMSDATVVIESAAKGGALITAELAESYHRDCFAFPGRCNDEYSIGCNNLIRKNQAVLITSAEDLVKAMGWESSPKTEKTVQRELFPDLSEEEERIVKRLGKMPEGLQINTLVIDTNIPVNRMSALLFELEMKGVIRALAGGVYRLIM